MTDYVLKDHLSRLPLVVARALEERALRDARTLMVEALRQSEASSLLLFAHNPLPMWVYDTATLQFLEVNDAAIYHYGYDRMEFLRMSASDLYAPNEVPRSLADLQLARPYQQYSGQWHHRKKNGSIIDVELALHTMEYSGREAMLVVAQDVTERKRAEEGNKSFLHWWSTAAISSP